MDTSPRNKYKYPTQAPKHIKESNSNQEIITEYRKSPIVPRVSANTWKIKAELRNSDEDKKVINIHLITNRG